MKNSLVIGLAAVGLVGWGFYLFSHNQLQGSGEIVALPATDTYSKYVYDAQVTKVYDGDTITLNVDLGFDIWFNGQTFRLYGIDAPELRGDTREEGIESRNFLHSMIPVGSKVIVKTDGDKKDKYGRWLATIFRGGNINQKMVDSGHAVQYP